MSSEFWSALNKKKREELLGTADRGTEEGNVKLESSDFWSALSPEIKKDLLTRGTTESAPTRTTSFADDDDIAPVKGGNKDSVFKSGGFSDGVDGVGDFFGDLTETTLGTAADLGLGILKGVGRMVEGVVDLGTYGVAGVADLFGADEFAEKTKKVAQYSATDKWTKGATDFVDQYSVLGNKADMVSEGLGQVGAIILTGGLAGAAGLGTAGATALTTGLTGLSGVGSGMNEAYESGASDGEAFAYGVTVGTIEAVSELIFGGLGKGVKALGISKGLTSIDDIAAKKISNIAAKYIASEAGQKIVGNTLEYAVKSGAEGLEEVISGFGSAIAKDVYLMNGEDEKAFGEILKDEKLLEQFVVGSIVSGIAQGGDFIKANKTGRDFVSGLSKNEQTVVDKVYEQRLAEESKERTLSNRDKNKLYDRVVEEMKRGYVSTDEIESILGGETYKGYKDITEQETALQSKKKAIEDEIKKLVQTPESQFTIEQRERLTSLREEAKGIEDQIKGLDTKTVKSNLFNEVNKLTTNDTYLRESYNDLIRQTQDLQIDENQYNGTKFADAAKKTIANARKAGASNSNRVRDFVEFSAKYSSISGTVVDFKNDNQIKQILENQLKAEIATLEKSTVEADKEKLDEIQDMLKKVQEGEIRVNGVKTKDGVAINIKSSNYLNVILGHEVTHFLEGKKAYEPLQKAIFKYAQSKGDYEGRRKVVEALYKNIKDTTVDYELTADLVGDYLFTEYDFIKNLSTENRNVFTYVFDQLKYMYKLATAGSKEARELENVMHQFEKVLRESAETSQSLEHNEAKTNFSLRTKPAPQKTQEVYKLMRLKDGEIYPLFIDSTEPLKVGEWYDADSPNLDFLKEMPSGVFLVDANNGTYQTFDEYLQESGERKTKYPSKKAIEKATAEGKRWVYIEDTAKAQKRFDGETRKYWNIGINGSGGVSTFSMRPGYHAGSLPTMRQIGKGANKDLRDDSFVWTVGEVPADIDYQAEAEQNPDKDIPTHIPEDGYYLKATNADKVKSQADRVGWYVAGAYKINRIISDSEARQVIDNWNTEHPDTPVEYDYDRESGMDFDADQMKLVPKSDTQYSLSSMANTFYGDGNMSSVAFEKSNYKETVGYKNYVEQCVNNMRQTRTDFDEAVARREIENQIDGIVRVALAAKKAGYDILDDAKYRDKDGNLITDSKNRLLFSSLEPNSDYFTSNDISTICDKRKNFAEIYDEIVKTEEAKGVPQGKRFFDNVDNYFALHKIMADKGLTQPCRQCYVESMRKNLAPMANAFLKLVNETDINNKANDQLYQPSGKNKGTLKTNNAELRERVLAVFEEHPEYNMSVGDLTVEMLTTEDGLAQLKIQAPLVYEAFNSFYGQSKPKMPKSATPFRFGELTALLTDHNGKIKQSLVDKINATGGFRLQSYSDFQTQNFVDVLQVIFEAGTLGLNGHAYTKVPSFLEATEGTNLKRNISIFMYKDGNEWKLDKNDSFPYDLEEIYNIVNSDKSGNTGIIAVSQNKDMSCWIMANDYIAYGIPFHKSGLKMGTVRDTDVKTDDGRIIKGYSGTVDHTKQQTEVWAKSNEDHKAFTKVKKGINIYSEEVGWDFDNKDNLPKNKLIEKNIKAYIDACERAGYLPKFRDYVMNNGTVLNDVLKYSKELGFMPQDATIEDISFEYKGYTIPYGYYKFLGDFSMFTPDGNASPHKTLSLENYDFDKAENFFADAEGLRRNEILQQFANGEERQRYRDSNLTAEELTEIVNQKRKEVAESIVAPVKQSLSYEGETRTPGGSYRFDGKDFLVKSEQDIAPVAEDVAENATTTNEATTNDVEAPFPDAISPMTEEEANALQTEKANADAKLEGEPKTRKQLHNNIINDIKATFSSGGYDFDDALSKAKDLSTFSTVDNTPQRVMEKALGYKEGQVLADLTVNKVAQNETAGIKWLNSFTDRKNGLLAQISKEYNIKPGSKESAAAQMYAEGFYVNEDNEIVEYGDRELEIDFPNEKVRSNIKGLARDTRIRQIYDATLDAINKSRTRNAYPEIQKLDNYFLHFRAMEDTFSKLGLPFNPNDIKAKDLPTDLNGVTADLKPGQPYFASSMHRKGKRTSFDLLGGLERYLTSAKNQIYHIDDIQTLRALRNYIADNYGQANGLEGIDMLTEEEAQERIEQVYGSHLSTFAKFLNEEANILAGKTALIDRGLEGVIGRRGMTFLDTVKKQTGSNMVGFNISSSLTNFIPVAQTFAKTNKFDFLKAFAQTTSNKLGSIFGKGDNFAENSPVMIRRNGADRFYRTPFQKVGDSGYFLMSAVDNISTELIARTKFNELTRKGMSEQQAHIETDKWVSRLMGDRSLGQMPQLYNSKTLGFITQFQLEVRNQLDSQFYDTIQEAKVSNEEIENNLLRNAKTAAKVTSTFVQLAVAQHLFGKAFESVAGYNPAFDIIEVLSTMFGFDDEEDDEDTALDNIEQGFLELLEDLPYTSAFTGGGRIPISSALPISELITGKDSNGNEKSRVDTLLETAPYYILPGGYGQIKKTTQGLGMFSDDHPIAGSYTDSGNLRFPVEDTPLNRVQAGIFGQYASKNAREYFDNNYAPLKEKQIEEYMDVDLPIADYWKYREGLSGLKTNAEKADYINSLDIKNWQKNLLMNNILDRKEDVDMSNYGEYSDFEEFDYAQKYPEKHAFAKSVGGYSAYKTYSDELYDIKADKDASGKSITGSRKEKVLDYINNLDADYETKIILWKSEYPSDDTYNMDIINYINNRTDLTYDERVAIFTELGFTVSDGSVYWD